VPRFSYALLGAIALHGLALTLRVRPRPDSAALKAKAQLPNPTLEVAEYAVDEVPADPVAPAEPAAPQSEPAHAAPAAHAASSPAKVASAVLEAAPEAATEGDALAAPVVADSAAVADAAPARKIDLGLDGRFFLHDPGPAQPAPAPAAELGPRARKSTVQRQLDAALSAGDVQRGLARGNALLGSLSSAVRAEGPQRGEAIFRATVSADGSFASVELVGGTASEWHGALTAFRRLAASKHVRLPPGAKGLRVIFSVKAKVQRPSGKEVNDSAVRVDTPSGTPVGVGTAGDFDLADLAGGAQRLVYARVVSEEVL